jgi:hypothetical protein
MALPKLPRESEVRSLAGLSCRQYRFESELRSSFGAFNHNEITVLMGLAASRLGAVLSDIATDER